MSTISILPYKPEHLLSIELQPNQRVWRDRIVKGKQAEAINIPGMSFTGFSGGKIIGSAGFVPQWEGRVIGWALLSPQIPKMAWVQIVRTIKATMERLFNEGTRRIEITVPAGFAQGIRFAKMLGFAVECKMTAYQPDGSDAYLFAKIR